MDSNRVIQEVMRAEERNEDVKKLLSELFKQIDKEDFPTARRRLSEVEEKLGEDDPEVTRARTLLSFLEAEIEDD
jgi:thioredoxin-like negative regulator of GroEL